MAVAHRTRIAYALPAFALAVVGVPINVYVATFCTDAVGVDFATIDYDERTSILGLRDGLLMLGTVCAAASPIVAAKLLHPSADGQGERTKFAAVALSYAPILSVFFWIRVAGVREHVRTIAARPAGAGPAGPGVHT